MDRGTWRATVQSVPKSQTRLMRLNHKSSGWVCLVAAAQKASRSQLSTLIHELMQHSGPVHQVPAPAHLTHIWDWVGVVVQVGGFDAHEHYLHVQSLLITMTLQMTHSLGQSRLRLILANSIQFGFSWFIGLAIGRQGNGFGWSYSVGLP